MSEMGSEAVVDYDEHAEASRQFLIRDQSRRVLEHRFRDAKKAKAWTRTAHEGLLYGGACDYVDPEAYSGVKRACLRCR